MAINYATLKTEISTDPAALGCVALFNAGNDNGLAEVLNFVRDGVAACPVNGIVGAAITVFRNDIVPKEVVNAITSTDFSAATQIQISKLNLLFIATPIDATLANVRANFSGIFPAATFPTTNANLVALASRNGSRAEQLFGTGTRLTAGDIATARRS